MFLSTTRARVVHGLIQDPAHGLRRIFLPCTRVNTVKKKGRESSGPRPTNCLTSGLPPRLGDGADLPHQAQVLGDAPRLGDLASLYAIYRDARKVHLLPVGGMPMYSP